MFYFRYSRWDGSQNLPDFDADEALADMADDILGYGDLQSALQRMMQQGMRPQNGPPMRGLKDLLDRLKQRRQQQMNRFDLGSSLDDIKEKLEQVMQKEREGTQRVPDARERARREEKLGQIPPDAAGRLRDLQKHDFASAE